MTADNVTSVMVVNSRIPASSMPSLEMIMRNRSGRQRSTLYHNNREFLNSLLGFFDFLTGSRTPLPSSTSRGSTCGFVYTVDTLRCFARREGRGDTRELGTAWNVVLERG